MFTVQYNKSRAPLQAQVGQVGLDDLNSGSTAAASGDKRKYTNMRLMLLAVLHHSPLSVIQESHVLRQHLDWDYLNSGLYGCDSNPWSGQHLSGPLCIAPVGSVGQEALTRTCNSRC